MKYILFSGVVGQAFGGIHDFAGSSESVSALITYMGDLSDSGWWHIVNRDTLKIVAMSHEQLDNNSYGEGTVYEYSYNEKSWVEILL